MYAHIDHEKGKKQTLETHLFNTAELAGDFGKKLYIENIMYLLGILHDLGKADRKFQDKIKNNTKDTVNHSSAGAKYLLEISTVYFKESGSLHPLHQEFIEIMTYVISAHHGVYNVPDLESAYGNRLLRRIAYDKEETYYYSDDVKKFSKKLENRLLSEKKLLFSNLIDKAFNEYISFTQLLEPKDASEEYFYRGLTIRLLLSALKNADIFDTINAYEEKIDLKQDEDKEKLKESYLEKVEDVYKEFENPTTEINKIRNKLAIQAKQRGKKDSSGIYRLNLPTGAGKTRLSLRYASHQLANGKGSFFYITPYLSVLEQNAADIKAIIGEAGVLEHHSNIVDNAQEDVDNSKDDTKEEAFHQYLLDTWDSSAVLSTMVQFFQTLFKTKSGNIRRFANLANSVIILDEVQSLPIEVTSLFNLTMNFISKAMNSIIILCTATQPTYDSTYIKHSIQYGGSENENPDIVTMADEDRKIFERTEVYKLNEDNYSSLDDIIEEVELYPDESFLIILNTKQAVNKLHERMTAESNRELYYLSTNLCPEHRRAVIKEIKEGLEDEKPIVCISTQLIEAGVDLDFNRLIRSYAGIDSITQAMGRCNREGKNEEKGIVKLVKIPNEVENLTRLRSIKDKKKVTEYLVEDMESPIDIEKLNDSFFEYYYANSKERTLDYPTDKDAPTVYDYLSINSNYPQLGKYKVVQCFKTAASKFDLIQSETYSVIVYYNQNDVLIEELFMLIEAVENDYDFEKIADIKQKLKELQPYTLNLMNIKPIKDNLIVKLEGNVLILPAEFYDEKTGLKEEAGVLML